MITAGWLVLLTQPINLFVMYDLEISKLLRALDAIEI
jgi:hypothetical protein